jgi:hypothetical protein
VLVVVPQALVADKVYVPAAATVAAPILGFCKADEKLLGPLQLQLVAPVALPVRFRALPAQTGELEPAETAEGTSPTTTVTVLVVVPQALVADKVYVPAAAAVTLPMLGFCMAEEKLLGPLQLQLVAPVAEPERLSGLPTHTGELEPAETPVGGVLIVTDTVLVVVPQLLVADNVYVPVAAAVTAPIEGFCNAELKLLGPRQLQLVAPVAAPFKLSVPPAQIGAFDDAFTPLGTLFTVTVIVPGTIHPPPPTLLTV